MSEFKFEPLIRFSTFCIIRDAKTLQILDMQEVCLGHPNPDEAVACAELTLNARKATSQMIIVANKALAGRDLLVDFAIIRSTMDLFEHCSMADIKKRDPKVL